LQSRADESTIGVTLLQAGQHLGRGHAPSPDGDLLNGHATDQSGQRLALQTGVAQPDDHCRRTAPGQAHGRDVRGLASKPIWSSAFETAFVSALAGSPVSTMSVTELTGPLCVRAGTRAQGR